MVACGLITEKRVLLFIVGALQKSSFSLLYLFNQNIFLIFWSWFYTKLILHNDTHVWFYTKLILHNDTHVGALLTASLSSSDWIEAAPSGEFDVNKTAC